MTPLFFVLASNRAQIDTYTVNPIAADLFIRGYKLINRYDQAVPVNMPREPWKYIYCVHGEGFRTPVDSTDYRRWWRPNYQRITKLEQLQGLVKIDTAAKALEFVRLRTKVDHYLVWRPSIAVEVTPVPKPNFDNDHYAMEGRLGEIWEPNSVKIAQAYPIIQQSADHFQITRLLMVENGPGSLAQIKVVTEDVGPQGEYKITKSEPLTGPKWFLDILWRFPEYA